MIDDEEEEAWRISDEDRALLERLARRIRDLAPMAWRGNNLIVLGEIWNAIELILEGQSYEVNVGISVGFRRGDKDFSEGLFACFRIDDDGITLDELNTSYSSDVGSDHFTRDIAFLGRRGNFDGASVEEWIALLDQLGAEEDARLDTSRDHI